MSGHAGVPPELAALPSDELRAAVRAVLRDVLPAAVAGTERTGVAEEVTLVTGADLDSFVRQVATLCEDPAQRSALQDGRRRFRLAGASPDADVVRVDRGAVTERTVRKAAAAGARLVLGPRAVLTPLARDSARSLGIRVEREER